MNRVSVPTLPLAVAGSLLLHGVVVTGLYVAPVTSTAASTTRTGNGNLAADHAALLENTLPIYLLPEELPADVAATLRAEAERASEPLETVSQEPKETEVKPKRITLGTENGLAMMTRNWLQSVADGEHAAKLSRVEQPQLDRDVKPAPQGPTGEGGNDGDNQPGPAGAVAPPINPQPSYSTAEPRPPAPESDPRPSQPIPPQAPIERASEGPLQPETLAGNQGGTKPENHQPARSPSASTNAAPAQPSTDARKASQPQAVPSGGTNPAAPGRPGDSAASTKVSADRDSDASSVRRAAVFRNGKVEAGEGLDIRTVRPEFSLTTKALRSPASPELEVIFGKDGRARDVRIIKSSGFPDDVDRPVVNALFNWRARGKVLDELPRNGTVNLQITILLQ